MASNSLVHVFKVYVKDLYQYFGNDNNLEQIFNENYVLREVLGFTWYYLTETFVRKSSSIDLASVLEILSFLFVTSSILNHYSTILNL